LSAREEKLVQELEQAREQLQAADRLAHEREADLRAHATGLPRIEVLGDLTKALDRLKEVGGTCPLYGDEIDQESYADALGRAKSEIDQYNEGLPAFEKALDDARRQVRKAIESVDSLTLKLEKERQKRRRDALEAYRRQVAAEGFQAREGEQYFRSMAVPWGGVGPDDRRMRRLTLLVGLWTLLLAISVTNVIVPDIERAEEVKLPPRLAKLLIEREKVPPPKPKPKVEERKAEEKKLKPRKKAPKPTTKQQRLAREKARRSGLLAMSDAFDDLKDTAIEDKLGTQAKLTNRGQRAAAATRSIITSNVAASSGGIQTSSLSRGVGGSLGSRQSTQVTSELADQVAASADRRLTRSGKASRTDEEIQIVFDRNKSALYRLYNRALREDPTLQGKVVLKLTIAPSGQVTMCTVLSSSMKAPALERKIAQRVKFFNFGAKDVNAVTITYPIDFLPA